MIPGYAHRELRAGVENLVLDAALYRQGDSSALYLLAEHVLLEPARPWLEPARSALENQMLRTPLFGSETGQLGDQVSLAELREVMRRMACRLDNGEDWSCA